MDRCGFLGILVMQLQYSFGPRQGIDAISLPNSMPDRLKSERDLRVVSRTDAIHHQVPQHRKRPLRVPVRRVLIAAQPTNGIYVERRYGGPGVAWRELERAPEAVEGSYLVE